MGCSSGGKDRPPSPARLKVATTTSMESTGLFKVLLPPFEETYGIKVDVIAVGTGKALKLAERGDVDAVVAHAPEAEEAFMNAGFGVNRRAMMYNDFVLLGPASDPAGVKGAPDVETAFRRIAEAQAPFASRGDESGTHQKERQLWRLARVEPKGSWYIETGQGMDATLVVAHEKRGYTLADRSTYLTFKDKVDLAILVAGAPVLRNPYHVMAVNPARHRHVHYVEALAFIGWLTSPQGQDLIAEFRTGGTATFVPLAVPPAGETATRRADGE